MKKIKLTQEKYALVDDEDFGWINQHKWHAVNKNGSFYAVRKQYLETKNGKELYRTIYMAREIMETPENELCDHEDGNTLNNQVYNLRNCTKAENQRNRGPQKNNTSGHKNIYWHPQDKMWRVRISAKGCGVRGGLHHSIEEAIKERDWLIRDLHGDFARTEAFNG